MSVKVAGIAFDRVDYDREGDVLYLRTGAPSAAVDWDESEEGHGLSYDTDGTLVGLTIVNARRILEEDGEIAITMPTQRIVARDLDTVLAAA